eukprot:930439-Pleurochrysis_carterae.AAC.3
MQQPGRDAKCTSPLCIGIAAFSRHRSHGSDPDFSIVLPVAVASAQCQWQLLPGTRSSQHAEVVRVNRQLN